MEAFWLIAQGSVHFYSQAKGVTSEKIDAVRSLCVCLVECLIVVNVDKIMENAYAQSILKEELPCALCLIISFYLTFPTVPGNCEIVYP